MYARMYSSICNMIQSMQGVRMARPVFHVWLNQPILKWFAWQVLRLDDASKKEISFLLRKAQCNNDSNPMEPTLNDWDL